MTQLKNSFEMSMGLEPEHKRINFQQEERNAHKVEIVFE